MVSVARRLARVAISSASIFEWVSYDFEQINFSPGIHVNLCWSSRPRWVFSIRCNVILSYVFKDDSLCLLASFTCDLASLAHLHMYQLFTHYFLAYRLCYVDICCVFCMCFCCFFWPFCYLSLFLCTMQIALS